MPEDRRLMRVGVRAHDDGTGGHTYLRCGQHWWANTRPGGGYARGWWKCPNGCNRAALNISRPTRLPA